MSSGSHDNARRPAARASSRHPSQARAENRLLAQLPGQEYEHLRGAMEVVRPTMREVLYEQGAPIEHVYFPERGVFSIIIEMSDRGCVEVGTIGSEGMVGAGVALGGETAPYRAICQITGRALRMPVAAFKEAAPPILALHAIVRRYADAFMMHLAQSVACNRLHTAPQRMARWLCMTHDRVASDEFPMTQEFLAEMLGVRRQTVSEVAAELQAAGILHYHLGRMTIDDRAGLERAACECYGTIRGYFHQALGMARG